MADNKYRLPDDSANLGVFLDLSTRTVGGVTVCEERHVIVDNIANNYLSIAADGSILSGIWDGSNILGTSLHPIRTDTTGTTIQPVNGTVTANIGSAGSLALDASLTGGAGKIQIYDGVQVIFTVAHPGYVQFAAAQHVIVDSGAVTVSGTVTANQGGAPWTENVTQLAGTAIDVNSGNKSAGTQRVVLATDQPQLTNPLKVDGSAVTQPVSIAANVGVTDASTSATAAAVPAKASYIGGNKAGNLVGISLDGSGNLNVNVAAGGGAGGTSSTFGVAFPGTGTAVGASDGVNMQPLLVDGSGNLKTTGGALTPATSGGTSNCRKNSAASNNADTIKASAGQLYGVNIFNGAGYPIFVKIYNKASNPAPGTDNALIVKVFGVQAGLSFTWSNEFGVPCGTGIAIAVVKLISDTDNTSIAAGDCVYDVDFK